MSLIAWYPFISDCNDKINGNNPMQDSVLPSIDNNGKIGSCVSFSDEVIYINNFINNTTDNFTFAFWIKPLVVGQGNQAVYTARSIQGQGFSIFIIGNKFRFDYGGHWTTNQTLFANKWIHVAFVKQNNIKKYYINGKLVEQTTLYYTPTASEFYDIGTIGKSAESGKKLGNALKACLNDVRIYNEALTAKQIKEIAQAKICHYTFNENIQPIKNLCKQYPVQTKNWNSNIYPGTIFGEDEIGKYFIKQSTSYAYHGIGFDIPIQIGKYYTVSYELWCEKAFNIVYDYNIVCNNISGNDAPRAEEAILLGLAYDTPKRWKKFAMRSKAKDEAINPRLQDVIAGYPATNKDMVGTKIYYRNVMVEERDRETTYVEDSKSIVLKDVSSFNDLNITENQAHSFPAYKENSFKFSTYSEIVTNITLSTNNIGGDAQLTTISWIKPTAVPTVNSHGLIYGRGYYQGFGLYFGYHDSSHIAICTYHRLANNTMTTSNKIIKLDEWVQVACVLDNSNSKIKLYINGEKVSEATSSTGADLQPERKNLIFGGQHQPGGNGPWAKYEGHIKDFRMYATALSDEDIKLLYRPEINIDKSSVIRCSEINEEKIDNSKIGFYKNASIAYNEFNEISNIQSGIHNLKLGNEILPVLIDMDKDGGRWARVFYHNCKSGTVLFNAANTYAEAKETNKTTPTGVDKYSILSKLENFRSNTKSAFEFRLTYPTDTIKCNIWKQTSNPTHQKVTGYIPVKIDWTSNNWGGLEYSGRQECLADGSVNHNNWYYAIGATTRHSSGIPSSTSVTGSNSEFTAHDVELWVRINNYDLFADSLISNVSISRDGVITAKEFREI